MDFKQVTHSNLRDFFDISQKPNEALRKFDGDSAKYKMWADRMKDHMAGGNTSWKAIIKPLERTDNPITRA